MDNEPGLRKNYWIALLLSFAILIGYSFFMRWVQPSGQKAAPPPLTARSSAPAGTVSAPSPAGDSSLVRPERAAVIPFENNEYQIQFSTLGASLSDLYYKGEPGRGRLTEARFYSGGHEKPGLFGVRFANDETDLTTAVFKVARRGAKNEFVEFEFEKPGAYRLTKGYFFQEGSPAILLKVRVDNLGERQGHFPLTLAYGMSYGDEEEKARRFVQAVAKAEKILSADADRVSKKGFLVSKPVSWAGLLKHYFTLLVMPDWKAIGGEHSVSEGVLWGELRMEAVSLAPGASFEGEVLVYAGPQRYETLKKWGVGFEEILSRGVFGLFKLWILIALRFFNGFTHNYGWSIVVVTLLIKGIFTPLTHVSFEHMKKMQALQPKLKSLQERHKKDPAKLNQEMMALYKRNRVNPMMGCLPMVLQIPIFIAFYQGLDEAIELKGAPFVLWMRDLSAPDRLFTLPFSIPFLGDGVNILPILMIGSMVWQQKLTPTTGGTPEQTKIMNWMPLIFGFLFYGMPSGLVLYWFVNNVLSIFHQIFIKRMAVVLHHEDSD